MEFFKKFIPEAVLRAIRPVYHGLLAILASWYFGNPSSRMTVIGVTGTAGKSTTTIMLWKILNEAGKKCGYITTIGFSDGKTEYINKHGVSMPGGPLLQKQLQQMLKTGCQYAVVECTSEGLAQNRHLGLEFDAAVFTNLSEAHVETHGGFENYREAKGKLFRALRAKPALPVGRSLGLGRTFIVANLDDGNAEYFLGFDAQNKIGISFEGKTNSLCQKIYQAQQKDDGFELEGVKFQVKLVGEFNHYNALSATAAANALGVPLSDCAKVLSELTKIRGRMERVENTRDLSIFVDFGCEPATFNAALLAVSKLPHKRIVHMFGSTGGSRDVRKRFLFGEISARLADVIVITNDDVYGSDEEQIARDIKEGLDRVKGPERKVREIYKVLDRRAAIHRALEIAQAGDIILFTGKSSEQFLVLPGNKRIEWDEVSVVREELGKLTSNK